jgi:hypothetical protein
MWMGSSGALPSVLSNNLYAFPAYIRAAAIHKNPCESPSEMDTYKKKREPLLVFSSPKLDPNASAVIFQENINAAFSIHIQIAHQQAIAVVHVVVALSMKGASNGIIKPHKSGDNGT